MLVAELLSEFQRDYRLQQSEMLQIRSKLDDLHVRHRSMSLELSGLRDLHAKDQAEIRRLKGTVLLKQE